MDRVAETLYDDETMKVDLEVLDQVPFLHLEVRKWNKTVRSLVLERFENISAALYAHGWDRVFAYSPNPKFCKMLPGGEVIDTVTYSGTNYEVVTWQLEQLLLSER